MDMNEEAIVARLRENVPPPAGTQPAPSEPVPTGEPSGATGGVALDDMMQYKLHEYFGQEYRSADEHTKQRTEFIYKTIAERIGTSDYSYVVANIRNLEQVIGIAHADNRLYKMYEWLRLDGVRRKVSMEMEAVTG